jgi:hypothetical protein
MIQYTVWNEEWHSGDISRRIIIDLEIILILRIMEIVIINKVNTYY